MTLGPKLVEKGISGPTFISIGDEEMLKVFLENNPLIPPKQILIDDYGIAAYTAMGLKKIGQDPRMAIKGTLGMKVPNIDFKKYVESNISSFTSKKVTANLAKGVAAVSQNGATIGIDGSKVVYFYEEGVPGDNPDPEQIIAKFN